MKIIDERETKKTNKQKKKTDKKEQGGQKL